jgi:hypothetical protein
MKFSFSAIVLGLAVSASAAPTTTSYFSGFNLGTVYRKLRTARRLLTSHQAPYTEADPARPLPSGSKNSLS